MANAKTTSIPTVKNWSDFDHKTFYNGKEIAKANKSTAVPKANTSPACYYVNRNGGKGAWYYTNDLTIISAEDKEVLKSLQAHKKELVDSFMSHAINADQLAKRTEEVDEQIAKLSQ